MIPYRLNENIQLEVLEPRHADELFRLVENNRSYLRTWLPWLDDTREERDTLAYIQSAQKQSGKNKGFQCAIRWQSGLVGVIGFHHVDWANRKTAIGYWLGEQAQGKGIMTSSCRVLTQHALCAWRLNRVEIRCAIENAKSRAIPKRIGYQYEGTMRQAEWLYDHFVDHAVYAILTGEALR